MSNQADVISNQLAKSWQALLGQEPKLRIRDAAQRLGVSELELLQTKQGNTVFRLDLSAKRLANQLSRLGRVMSLVRNNGCVHEVSGRYSSYEESPSPVGLFLGEQDLRLFFNHWQFIYEVNENNRKSIQVFDVTGVAIIKIYAIEGTDLAVWSAVMEQYRSSNQSGVAELERDQVEPSYNTTPDQSELRKKWKAMTDVHQFHGILKSLNISRIQAFSLVEDEFATALDKQAMVHALTQASEREIPTIEFVQNKGVVQIHTAINKKLVTMGPWFNVLDPDFSLHLNTDLIDQVWAVRRPADSGMVSSIEAFDASGALILQVFGKRVEGQQERSDWAALVDECMASRALSSTERLEVAE